MRHELLCPNCGHHVAFVSDRTLLDENSALVLEWLKARSLTGRHTAGDLLADFREWAGDRALSDRAWGIAMREIGTQPYKSNGVRGYVI